MQDETRKLLQDIADGGPFDTTEALRALARALLALAVTPQLPLGKVPTTTTKTRAKPTPPVPQSGTDT